MDFRTDLRKLPDKNGCDDLPPELDPDFKEMIAPDTMSCEAHAKQEANGCLSGSMSGSSEDDELYTRCVNLVVTERKASLSLLQRRLCIGYGRAALMMDMMEERGVVSPPQGATRARVVLVEAPEQLPSSGY